jgi:spermidine synthase
VAAVIAWNANPDYALAGGALRDPRVAVRHADVVAMLREGVGGFDAIVLDVDNGAAPLTTAGNARLYGDAGIGTAVAALRPGGRLAYWSADDDPTFERALHPRARPRDVRAPAHALRRPPGRRLASGR